MARSTVVPTPRTPVGLVWNGAAGGEAGVDEYPAMLDDLLAACTTARDGGKSFTVLAGAIPFNTGLGAARPGDARLRRDTRLNEQRAAGDVTFADSGWRQVLEDIVAMNDGGCSPGRRRRGRHVRRDHGRPRWRRVADGSLLLGGAAASIETPQASSSPCTRSRPQTGRATSRSRRPTTRGGPERRIRRRCQGVGAAVPRLGRTARAGDEFLAELSGAVPITGVVADAPAELRAHRRAARDGGVHRSPSASWPNPKIYEVLGVGVQGLLTGQNTIDQVLDEMDAAWGE